MRIKIIQTSDPDKYKRMLDATALTVAAYCRRHDLTYECYVGIKRGHLGCHAAFNRIFMLVELIERGFDGWVIHMDADAYVYDLDFDIRSYLADKIDRSAVMPTIEGAPEAWHINSGVLMFNLSHPDALEIVANWKNQFLAIGDEELAKIDSVWGPINDQAMLFQTLEDSARLRKSIFFEEAKKINHIHGDFIRQYLGCFDEDIVSRTATVKILVADVLGERATRSARIDEYRTIVQSIYRATLGRDADAIGLEDYSSEIDRQGLSRGIEQVISSILHSPEGIDHTARRTARDQ